MRKWVTGGEGESLGRCWHAANAQGRLQSTRRCGDLGTLSGGQAGRAMGGGIGQGGGAGDAHPGHPSQERAHVAHTGPRRHAAPAPPCARVTLTFPPPPGQPGPAPARKTPRGSARVGVEGLRCAVQPQRPEAKPNASPAASSGLLGVWLGLSGSPLAYRRVCGVTRTASPRVSLPAPLRPHTPSHHPCE